MKKKIATMVTVIIVLITFLKRGTGFQKRTDVGLSDYSISKTMVIA
ncbi:MAG: hypothetical protein ACI4SR_04515 [Faecalibacillus sp.]